MSTDDSKCLESENCNKAGMNIFVKPNVRSLKAIDISRKFINIRSMELYNNIHGFPQSEKVTSYLDSSGNLSGEIANDSNNYDIHMIKNMEWGAVAYLTMSKYGKFGNDLYQGAYKEVYFNNYRDNMGSAPIYKTGYSSKNTSRAWNTSGVLYNNLIIETEGQGYVGAGASTTGTIYGVYDMSGGSIEFPMGNSASKNGKFNVWSATIWNDVNQPLEKYYDLYSYYYLSSSYNKEAITRGKLGDATKEIMKEFSKNTGTWFAGSSIFNNNWIGRGGNSGIFHFSSASGAWGAAWSSRPVLAISREFPWKDK